MAGTLIAIGAPLIGIFLVVKRYSPLADTLSHVSLVGVVLGLITGFPPLLTAIVTAISASIGIEKLKSARKIFGESVLAVFLSGSLGVAALLISISTKSSNYLNNYLFGSLATVTLGELWQIACVVLVVVIIVFVNYQKLMLVSLDEEIAHTSGLNIYFLNNLIIILAALIISVSISSIGVLLISSLLIIPVITAMQFQLGFRSTMLIAVILSLLSVWLGLSVSFYLDLSISGAIVCLNLVFFGLSLIWSRKV